jgi:N-acetylglucosaminyldiphosphoundecaprenol N-acetyl-beta-D-mannosaminyltransferase
MILWGRLLGHRLRREQRVTYVDWIRPLMAEAGRRGWRVFYLGGRPGVAQRAAEILSAEFPGLQLWTRHGHFDLAGAENEDVLREIAEVEAQVVMVGMGMPRQEYWILDNLQRLQGNAILPAGACFDYIAGAIPTPPRWMGRLGLEWLYRLVSEPGRLWRRYLVEPWHLLPEMMNDLRQRARARS